MMSDVINELIVGWIGAVLGWLAFKGWHLYRERFSRDLVKFTYFRVIRMRFRERGDSPYYHRQHHTIDGEIEPVYDETWSLNSIQSRVPELLHPVQLTSSGVVDAMQVLPTLDKDADNHPHSRNAAGIAGFSHHEKCTNLTAVGTLVNGLQKNEQWWFGTTAQYEGQTLILVVDFSSLPFERGIVHGIHSVLERNRSVMTKAGLESDWFEDQLGNDIFYLKFTNAQKGDVIKF
ncbi:MAG: hypothetical protein AAF664_05490, partial [Planctomycetota bacterium]